MNISDEAKLAVFTRIYEECDAVARGEPWRDNLIPRMSRVRKWFGCDEWFSLMERHIDRLWMRGMT